MSCQGWPTSRTSRSAVKASPSGSAGRGYRPSRGSSVRPLPGARRAHPRELGGGSSERHHQRGGRAVSERQTRPDAVARANSPSGTKNVSWPIHGDPRTGDECAEVWSTLQRDGGGSLELAGRPHAEAPTPALTMVGSKVVRWSSHPRGKGSAHGRSSAASLRTWMVKSGLSTPLRVHVYCRSSVTALRPNSSLPVSWTSVSIVGQLAGMLAQGRWRPGGLGVSPSS
jgi:hypothetical protein